MPRTIEGQMNASKLRIAIIAARFNDFIVDRLISGAMDYLTRHGMDPDHAVIIRVPGAFELPVVCKKVAESRKFDGIVALGAAPRRTSITSAARPPRASPRSPCPRKRPSASAS